MSGFQAVSAVTEAVKQLLLKFADPANALAAGDITTLPLDQANVDNRDARRINLYLYHVVPNAAWRNQNMPTARSGEVAPIPVALNLHYMLTAYGSDDATAPPTSHLLLGDAMRILNDHPVLLDAELKNIVPDSDLARQIERVRLTHEALTLEEMSKVWTSFQVQYRLSVSYVASVVLIDSKKPLRAAPPVLQRGPDVRTAFPTLNAISVLSADSVATARANQSLNFRRTLPDRAAAVLGDTLALSGAGFSAGTIVATLLPPNGTEASGATPLAARTLPVELLSDSDTLVALPSPADPDVPNWRPGIYTISLTVTGSGTPTPKSVVTNALPIAIAPTVTLAAANVTLGGTLQVTSAPPVGLGQHPVLLLGEQNLTVNTRGVFSDPLTATVPSDTTPDTYLVRLRVDGVDSQPFQIVPGATAGDVPHFAFADNQKVTVT